MGHSKIKRLAVFLALVFLFPVQAAAVREVVPIGHTAGIRMKSEGVLVVRLDTVQTADGERCPARDAGVRECTAMRPSGYFRRNHAICIMTGRRLRTSPVPKSV